jgi:hypothetical protein
MYPLHQNFSLALQQRLTGIESLSSIVNSFSRDTDQGSEATAVLLDLTEYIVHYLQEVIECILQEGNLGRVYQLLHSFYKFIFFH